MLYMHMYEWQLATTKQAYMVRIIMIHTKLCARSGIFLPSFWLPWLQFMGVYDYNPAHQSPRENSSYELAFHAGDVITVYGKERPDGFYYGEVRSRSFGSLATQH